MEGNNHEHCQHCYKANCNATKVCKIIYCECGFRFHECKSMEHSLLCYKETVPCPNAFYGCPVKLKRSRISNHLNICPASILVCTMQWNRYPLYSKSRLSWVPFFQPNPVLVKGHLDVELALRDQEVLQEMFKKRLRKGKAKVDILRSNNCTTNEEGEKNSKNVDTRRIDMAMALSALEHKLKPFKFISEASQVNFDASSHDHSLNTKTKQGGFTLELRASDFESGTEMLRPDSPRAAVLCENISSATRLTTANKDQDQLIERDEELHVSPVAAVGYDNGNYDNNSNANEASENTREILRLCLENNKEIIKENGTDHQFNQYTKSVTTGSNKGNYCQFTSTTNNYLTTKNNHEQKYETTEILTPEELETKNETTASFEQEESNITDVEMTSEMGEMNQENHNLPKPPKFAHIYLKEPLGLNVMLETLPKFQKQAPLYSIPCNQVFRRNEYGSHFKNVHSEIHGGLNGWVEHRCPFAQYGCTFIHHRLLPNNQCGRVTFDKELGSFGVRHSIPNKDDEPFNKDCPHHITMETSNDYFSSLPLEILESIADMLDGFTLCHLSRSSKLLRQVCQRVLEKKGLVSLVWEKRIYDNGSWSWCIRHKVNKTLPYPTRRIVIHNTSNYQIISFEICNYDH